VSSASDGEVPVVRLLFTMLLFGTAAGSPAGDVHRAALPPGEVVVLAYADALTLDPHAAHRVRYLSTADVDPVDVPLLIRVLGGHVNHLSRLATIERPVLVGGCLLRIDVDYYGRDFADAWERLGDQDPYFHALLETEIVAAVPAPATATLEYFRAPDGRLYQRQPAPTAVPITRAERKAVLSHAPWLFSRPEWATAAHGLIAATKSNAPVVSGQWFLYQTAVSLDRKPGYYDFLGVKDLKTYEQAIGFVEKGVDSAFLAELREAIAQSTVTLPEVVRRLVRRPKIDGGYWLTQDNNLKRNPQGGKGNALRVLNDDYAFQAVETFGHLPNGCFATGLFDQNGVRQDVAPDFIASDATAPYTDRKVHINLSCLRCHVDDGLKDVDGWVRNVLNRPPNALLSADPHEARRLREQYVRRLDPDLKRDRERYAAAVLEATGGPPREYSAGLAYLWKRYAEDAVTLERAARELGVTPECLVLSLREQGPECDAVLSAFRQLPPRTIPVAAWHEAYGLAQIAIVGRSCAWAKKLVRPEGRK
jgi:hypothetical protein